MVDLARQAIENKLSLEVKKDGLSQKQSGDWSLRLTVQAVDMDERIIKAKHGTRYWCSLIELNDDETPVDHKAVERDKWRDLGPAKQAGMRCKEPTFWAFLREGRHQLREVKNEETAATAVRKFCEVTSRSDFGKPGFHKQRTLWHSLDNEYQGWKAREHA